MGVGWTNLWRFLAVRSGEYHLRIKELHEKYGPVVRIGPNLLDLDYPELIKTLYGTDDKWRKVSILHDHVIVSHSSAFHFRKNLGLIFCIAVDRVLPKQQRFVER